jgi:thymidylate kinase
MAMMPRAAEWTAQGPTEPNGTVNDQVGRESPSGLTLLPPRLQRLFLVLEQSGERWCLLRPPAMLAKVAGDIDLLVEPSSRDRVRELLVGEGFTALPIRTRDLHAADYDRECDRFLWLHVQADVQLGGELVPARAVLDTMVRDPLPRPADDWLFWIVLLHDIFEKGEIPERHRAELSRLASSTGDGPAALREIALAHGLDADALLESTRSGNWGHLQRPDGMRTPSPRPLRERLAASTGRLAGLRTWRGASVAIMGPDGAGKTTLVYGLRSALPFPSRLLYMGLKGGGRLPRADALRVPGLVLAARLVLLWARYGLGLYHRARGRIVLIDRCTLDGKVHSGEQLGALARLSRRVQAVAVPRPELLLVLDASGATMHARKGEYDPQQLDEWREAYRRLPVGGRPLHVLDAEQPADAVRRDAQARIWQHYVQRWTRA